MKKLLLLLCNLVLLAGNALSFIRFRMAISNPMKYQKRYLSNLLDSNQDTAYGKTYGFPTIRSVEEYQQQVPLTTYEDYRTYIQRAADGESNVLTQSPILLFELSSGSSSASKWIPYTNALKAEFQKGIQPWLFDMYWTYKGLLMGSAYWSITPLTTEEKIVTKGGIPVGFEEDAEYLGTLGKKIMDFLMAVPPEVKYVQSIESFRYITLLFLLRDRHLSFISVWNPTFLLILLDQLPAYWSQILQDIEQGSLTLPAEIDSELYSRLLSKMNADTKRAAELRKLQPYQYTMIWKNLSLISCWADGNSASYFHELKQRFDASVNLQAKGLLSTEAFVSLPLGTNKGHVLSVRSHFFEFLPVDDKSKVLLLNELEAGKKYSLVVTTGGGFYRYQTFDVVEVLGFKGRTPVIRFIGKEDKVSDHFGEKINEYHVTEILDSILRNYRPSIRFAMLAFDLSKHGAHYTLFIETEASLPYDVIRQELEAGLLQNFHYKYCRTLGQLAEVRIFKVSKNATEVYLTTCLKRGQKLGNIKPGVLHASPGWNDVFDGEYL